MMHDDVERFGYFAPWISDPDPPDETMMTSEESAAAAARAAARYPELIDHSMDGPLRH
jgi:hypothetical protein